jgi:hypothetical protein
MRYKEIIIEASNFAPIQQPKVEDMGEPLGVVATTVHQINGRTYHVMTYRDFEEDLGPLYQLGAGGAQQIKRPPPRTGSYTTDIFDIETDGDMVAVIQTTNGRVQIAANQGVPAYQLQPKFAMALYRTHFPVAKPWLDSQKYPDWARTGYEDYNDTE